MARKIESMIWLLIFGWPLICVASASAQAKGLSGKDSSGVVTVAVAPSKSSRSLSRVLLAVPTRSSFCLTYPMKQPIRPSVPWLNATCSAREVAARAKCTRKSALCCDEPKIGQGSGIVSNHDTPKPHSKI